jgi:hypothetical protein
MAFWSSGMRAASCCDGEIAFGALKGFLDVRYGTRDGSACAEFSWEGNDENDPASGR